MEFEAKVCRECGEEFVYTALRCSDCGGELVPASQYQAAPRGEAIPEGENLVALRAGGPAWVGMLAEALTEREISHWVVRNEQTERESAMFTVCVHRDDAERAKAVDAEVERTQMPDMPDAEHLESNDEGCPACGAAVSEDAAECSDCGLVFG